MTLQRMRTTSEEQRQTSEASKGEMLPAVAVCGVLPASPGVTAAAAAGGCCCLMRSSSALQGSSSMLGW